MEFLLWPGICIGTVFLDVLSIKASSNGVSARITQVPSLVKTKSILTQFTAACPQLLDNKEDLVQGGFDPI